MNAYRRLARHAFNQNVFGFQFEAEIIGQIRDAAVFDACFRLEFECCNHRAGIDLGHLPVHFKFGVFLGQHVRQQLEFFCVNRLLSIGTVQQAAGRKLVAAGDARHGGLRL